MRRATWVLLIGGVVAAYGGWAAWAPPLDYTLRQAGGLVVTLVVLMGLAVRRGLRPRPVVNVVFWVLLTVAFVDITMIDGEPMLLPLAAFYGPVAWLCFIVPAMLLEDRMRPPAPPPVAPVVTPPEPDAQVAAWRRYRDRMTGG